MQKFCWNWREKSEYHHYVAIFSFSNRIPHIHSLFSLNLTMILIRISSLFDGTVLLMLVQNKNADEWVLYCFDTDVCICLLICVCVCVWIGLIFSVCVSLLFTQHFFFLYLCLLRFAFCYPFLTQKKWRVIACIYVRTVRSRTHALWVCR